MHEAANRLDPKKFFLKKDLAEPILNLPFGSHFFVDLVLKIKQKYPHVDKIRPFSQMLRWAIVNETVLMLKSFGSLLFFFAKSIFIKDPRRHWSFKRILKILFESADTVATPHFKPKASAIPGNVYSVSELITLMIRDSDNNATLLLNQLLGSEKTQFTYSDLGIKPPTNQNYSVTVRTYASFFRILYNATYLNREYSDKALHLLTESAFTKGLRAGVPTSIPIAHKFGERTILEGQENQLHDCGIVYYPGRPYLLCVMTRGSDYENMADAIKTISSIIYKEIKAE
jgi:hypothetical protein